MNLLHRLSRRYMLRWRAEYMLVLFIAHGIQALSPRFAWKLARGAAFVMFHAGVRRKTMLHNLAIAFPEWSDRQRRRVALRSLQHFASMTVDLMFQRRMVSPRTVDRHFVTTGWARDYMAEHGPEGFRRRATRILFSTAHLGNWELASGYFSLLGVRISPVYRATNNPWLNRLIRKLRLDQQTAVIERRGAVQQMLDTFERNENVGILCDQSAVHGIYVPFFGVQACTHKTPAVLIRDYGVRVVQGVVIRRGDFLRYEVRGRLLEFDPPTDDRDADLHRITRQLLQNVEEEVRRFPEQYFWLHRRFKRSPQAAAAGRRSQEVETQ